MSERRRWWQWLWRRPVAVDAPSHEQDVRFITPEGGVRRGIYRHKNGQLYMVLGMARHTETSEVLVVYQALYGDYGLFARPLENFKKLGRFRFVQDFDFTPTLPGSGE